jgi:DNA processing protein
MNLSDFDIYALFCTSGIGNRKINSLLKSRNLDFESIECILSKSPDEIDGRIIGLGKKDNESLRSMDIGAVKAEYDLMLTSGVELITAGSDNYPSLLREKLDLDAPAILFGWGNHDIISRPAVAIVGSRHASDQGEEFARRMIEGMKGFPISIISGGARGIDMAAHRSAVEHGLETLVVLAHGISHVLREQNENGIMRNVLFLSQFHPNSGWSPACAMIRNRTVCALSRAVFVIEAAESGGTINTGETALKMNIPLYVVSPDEFKIPPPGNRYLISKGGRELFLDSLTESFGELSD